MWLLSTETVHVYLTSSQVSARLEHRDRRNSTTTSLGKWKWSSTEPTSLQWHGERPTFTHGHLKAYIGAGLLKTLHLPIPDSIQEWSEIQKIAESAWKTRFAIEPQGWNIQVTRPRCAGPVVVTAISRAVFARINCLAGELKCKLISVRPFAFHAVNTLLNPSRALKNTDKSSNKSAAIFVVEPDAFSSFVITSGLEYSSITTSPFLPLENDLMAEARRLCAGQGVNEQAVTQLSMNGDYSSADTSYPFGQSLRPDFLEGLQWKL